MLEIFKTEEQWKAARAKDITSTDCAALFGLHPYKSRLRLWYEKAGFVEPEDIEDLDPVKWGRRLQLAVGMGICEDQGWIPHDLSLYYHHDARTRTGASYDMAAFCRDRGGLINLEIKIAESFSPENGWLKNEIPTMYEFQIQGQLHEAEKSKKPFILGACGAFGRRSSSKVYFREYDRELGEMIDDEALIFWKSIEDNNPPPPDYMVDGPLLERLRKPLRAGDRIILSTDNRACELAAQYIELRDARKALNRDADIIGNKMAAIEAEILDKMGRNEYAKIGEYRVSAKKIIVEDHIVYGHERRNFSISKQK